MLSCSEVLARHSEYMDGALALDESGAFEEHLQTCPRCARYDRTLRKGVRLLSDQAPIQPSDDFLFRLHSRISEEEDRQTYRPVSLNAATSVSIAAILAVAAWAPVVLKHFEDQAMNQTVRPAMVSDVNSSDIAWRGVISADEDRAQHPRPAFVSSSADASLIDHGYTPLILEPPTAPPSYVRLTSLEMR